jgi:hypothetical protein
MASDHRHLSPSNAQQQPLREAATTPSTVLKWSSDGELSALDLQRLVDLLQQTDPVAEALLQHCHFNALKPQHG